jgi:1,2-phenylacetyl-CoA epoxidase catalytic subunit
MLLPNWQDNIQTIVCVARNGRAAQDKLMLLLDESWPELLGALFQASQSTDPGMREGAFKIFATTPGIIERQHENTVQEAFSKGFRDENVEVG